MQQTLKKTIINCVKHRESKWCKEGEMGTVSFVLLIVFLCLRKELIRILCFSSLVYLFGQYFFGYHCDERNELVE